jgi:eukaryotic-like serine/threonine-protein kinase
LRKDPERRFQHMQDLKVALQELKEESESGRLVTPGALPQRARRGWVAGIAAGISVLVVLTLSP